MLELHPLATRGSPACRPIRAMAWLVCVLLVVVGSGIYVLFNQSRVSRVVVPKFEIGGKVVVQVVGPDGLPLEGVMVTPCGLRSDQDPSSGFGWSEKQHGPSATVLTDARGMAEIPYPKWTVLESAMLTSGIIVAVEHTGFVSQWQVECPIGSTVPQVQLSDGGRVRLRVFRSDQTNPVTDFLADISGRGYRKEWTLDGDARVSPVLPLEERLCRVVHFDKIRGTQFSELIHFSSAAGKTEDLEVRLQPGLKVRGRLAASVPRPVSNGFVVAVIADETTDGDYDKCLNWQDWVAISEQGEFDFAALPFASEVRLLTFCDGFVSQQPAPADLPEHMRRNQAWISMPQCFKVSGSEVVAEVAMEPAASARFQVVDARGLPLEGVDVGVSPNVIYSTGSTIFGQSRRRSADQKHPGSRQATRGSLPRQVRRPRPIASALLRGDFHRAQAGTHRVDDDFDAAKTSPHAGNVAPSTALAVRSDQGLAEAAIAVTKAVIRSASDGQYNTRLLTKENCHDANRKECGSETDGPIRR